MRILYECGDCGYRWKGRKPIEHPSRCPNCNKKNIYSAGRKIWSNLNLT